VRTPVMPVGVKGGRRAVRRRSVARIVPVIRGQIFGSWLGAMGEGTATVVMVIPHGLFSIGR